MSDVQSIAVGNISISLLRASVVLDDTLVDATLSAPERIYASGIGSGMRRSEYVRSRYLIRKLTGFKGLLPRSPEGVPSWPPAQVGCISHKSGHVAVALAQQTAWRSLGIDLEEIGRMKLAFEPRLASSREGELLTQINAKTGRDRTAWLAACFSFKEALFKSHFPIGNVMFYFLDAEIEAISPQCKDTGFITARLNKTTSPVSLVGSQWHGAYRFFDIDGVTFVLTSLGVSHPV